MAMYENLEGYFGSTTRVPSWAWTLGAEPCHAHCCVRVSQHLPDRMQ